jgi:hypothetical protein
MAGLFRYSDNHTDYRKATAMRPDTDYKAWHSAMEEVRAKGNIDEFVFWMIMNPSPMLSAGLFSTGGEMPPTHEQIHHAAFTNAAVFFKGEQVEIRATDQPEASARWSWRLVGTLRGVGSLAAEGNGAPDTDIIVVENENGRFVTARVSHVTSMENAR